jgi:hypothetical protein
MPAAAAKPAESMLDFVIKLAAVGVFVVGVATLASPWLRGSEHDRPLPLLASHPEHLDRKPAVSQVPAVRRVASRAMARRRTGGGA